MKTAVIQYDLSGEAGEITVLTSEGKITIRYANGLARLEALRVTEQRLEDIGLHREHRALKPTEDGSAQITLLYL